MSPALLLIAALAAPSEEAPAKVAVDFARPESGPRWFSAALQELVTRSLGRFTAVQIADPLDAAACPSRETRCLIEAYHAAGVEVVVLGATSGEKLEYEVFATWSGARAFGGSIELEGTNMATLERRIGEIVRPIVTRGGLIDEARWVQTEPAVFLAAPLREDLFAAVIALLVLLLLLPSFAARLLAGRDAKLASEKWSLPIIAGLLLLGGLVFYGRVFRPAVELWELVLPIAAGMLWGLFVLLNAGWVFAPIHGLGRVRHDALWPLLKAWMMLSFLRALVLILYLPPALLGIYVFAEIGFSERAIFGMILPLLGLLLVFWLLALVESLTLFLDRELVVGPADESNAWHLTIRRYFLGYVRRNGVELDPQLAMRALFLPSPLENVESYGGGFARPRILVGWKTRELALGELPDETAAPERNVNLEEWPVGLIVPSGEDDRPKKLELLRRKLTTAAPRPRGQQPRLLGENATLLGWIMPQSMEQSIPLIANDRDDYHVVRKLLSTHYAAFTQSLGEDEVDDTDPTQKDFLFGALLREIGGVRRYESLFSTIELTLNWRSSKASWLSRLFMAAAIEPYKRLLSGPAAMVADAYVALNHGLHHLIQYLLHVRDDDSPLLTARAGVPDLLRTSKIILDRAATSMVTAEDRKLLAATPRNRLIWLSRFFHRPLFAERDQRLRRIFAFVFAAAFCALFVRAVDDAFRYHPHYVERMSAAEAQKEGAPDERP